MKEPASALCQYWEETGRPLVNLVFVVPLLVAYEAGLLVLGPHAMRNGADVWLRQTLEFLGFTQYFLLPLLTCGLLLAWHHVSREAWRLPGRVLYGMVLESLGYGAVLIFVAQLHHSLLAIESNPAATALVSARDAVSYIGAGIYEELVFRLILLPVLVVGLRLLGTPQWKSLTLSVVICSLVFAAAHHRFEIGANGWLTCVGEPFVWSVFWFRFTAGAVFSLLFLFRGFGIAVGSHALYDILVG